MYKFLYENAYFSRRFGLPSACKRRFWSPKSDAFENALQNGAIRKRWLIVFVWTAKMETFENDDNTPSWP